MSRTRCLSHPSPEDLERQAQFQPDNVATETTRAASSFSPRARLQSLASSSRKRSHAGSSPSPSPAVLRPLSTLPVLAMLDRRCKAGLSALTAPAPAPGPPAPESELSCVVAREGAAGRFDATRVCPGGVGERVPVRRRGDAAVEGSCCFVARRAAGAPPWGVEMVMPAAGPGAEGRRPGEEKGAARLAATVEDLAEEEEVVDGRGAREDWAGTEGVGSGRSICGGGTMRESRVRGGGGRAPGRGTRTRPFLAAQADAPACSHARSGSRRPRRRRRRRH